MTSDTETRVWDALKTVRFPGMSRDIVSFGFVHHVQVSGSGDVEVGLQMSTHNPEAAERVRVEVDRVVRAVEGVGGVHVAMQLQKPAAPAGREEAVPAAGAVTAR